MARLEEVLRATSRTFAIGIELLPQPLRKEVTVAYLILRISDFLEDNRSMTSSDKIRLLGIWESVLAGETAASGIGAELRRAQDSIPDTEAAHHAVEVWEALRSLSPEAQAVIAHHTRQSTLGMARWVERGPRFDTEGDLDDYMHEVAGRVGYLLTDLFALRCARIRQHSNEMRDLGREFGLALQTVNVIRGLHEDRERGWVFVPKDLIHASGVSPQEIFQPQHRNVAVQVVSSLASKADRHFRSAISYVHEIPRRHHRVRVFCLLPLFFGIRTLAISRSNPEVLLHEVKVSRKRIRAITRAAIVWGFSNAWIDGYSRRLARAD